ncbi:MAG: hypothetical protein LBP20_07560 [Treponema sp.]|nr:hypothetical protein [Treponema sp.]
MKKIFVCVLVMLAAGSALFAGGKRQQSGGGGARFITSGTQWRRSSL